MSFKNQVEKKIQKGNVHEFVKDKARVTNMITSLVRHISATFSRVELVSKSRWKRTKRESQKINRRHKPHIWLELC